MENPRVLNFLLTVLFLINSTVVFGQKSQPKRRVLEPDTTITSKIMDRDYQLYISFPEEYSIKDTTRYPVLYALDGHRAFPLANSIREINNELEDVIIVCIGSGLDRASWFVNRTYDYTPSRDTIIERLMEKQYGFPKGSLHSGGGEKFLQCLTKEIIPYLDKHYKTNNDRGITGHSLGGLFAAYCLLNSEGIFNRYGILSPELSLNSNEILTQAESLLSENSTWQIPAKCIFISVGALEWNRMISQTIKFNSLLESRAFNEASLTFQLFEGETHLSVCPASISRALSVLYKKKSVQR